MVDSVDRDLLADDLPCPIAKAESQQPPYSGISDAAKGNYVRLVRRPPVEMESLRNRRRELLRDEQFGCPPGRNDWDGG
jgi:hypothetical protein